MKKLLPALGATLLCSNAYAYDVGGIDLPLDTTLLFSGSFVQALVDDGLGNVELQGYGNINLLQAPTFSLLSDLCVTPNCALTYTFTGLDLVSQTASLDGNGIDLAFDASNAEFDFWLQTDGGDYSVDASHILEYDGNSWASTYAGWNAQLNSFKSANEYLDTTSLDGTFVGEQKLNSNSQSSGYLEVQDQSVGAGWYYDKEGSAPAPGNSAVNFDIAVLASIIQDSFSNSDIQSIPGVKLSATGNHLFTTSVPEPSTLAMFSVALLGFGAAARRRRQA